MWIRSGRTPVCRATSSRSPSKSGPWLFCVSANGNRDPFGQILRAVRAAPEVPGWKVQAFRPRGPLTAEIEMGGRTLGPHRFIRSYRLIVRQPFPLVCSRAGNSSLKQASTRPIDHSES